MRNLVVVLICTILFAVLNNAVCAVRPPHVIRACAFGADTKVVFKVVDHMGNPVSGANVRAGFYMNREPGKNLSRRGVTDKDGVFVARQDSVGEVNYIIHKDNYYVTTGRIDFRNRFNWEKCVSDEKWQPYGETYNVIIKPKVNPIPLVKWRCQKNILLNTAIGFDLEKGDCVKPYGKGNIADFVFKIEEQRLDTFRIRSVMTLSFTNEVDGAYVMSKDMFSDYKSVYNADTNATFRHEFVFEYNSLNPKNMIDTLLRDNQYLVLRTRTRVNEKSEITEAYYSKIYGRLNFTHERMTLKSFFNPNLNDTNLEYEKEAIPWNFEER